MKTAAITITEYQGFQTAYDFTTPAGRTTATVTVRAGLGLQPTDELILWGLLGATLNRRDTEPVLLATPYWMLRHLVLETGGSQYTELRESLVPLFEDKNQKVRLRAAAAYLHLSVAEKQ